MLMFTDMPHLAEQTNRPDFAAAAPAARNCQDWQLGILCFQEQLDKGHDEGLSKVIVACARAQQWEAGLQLLADIVASKIVPSVYSCSAALTACEKGLQWQLALRLLTQMSTVRTAPNLFSYNATISACEKNAEWQMALSLLSQMPSARVVADVFSFSACISACEKVLSGRRLYTYCHIWTKLESHQM